MSWRSPDGGRFDARVTVDNVKRALLDVGTQGRFTVYEARTGIAYGIAWWQGINVYSQLRRGWYQHGR